MEARIRKDDLVAFKIQATNIQQGDNNMPILNYIRIQVEGDFCYITKSNNKAFIIKSIPNDSEDCDFLVDENIFNSFVDYSTAEYVNFKIEGIRITLSDINNKRQISPTESAKGFPFIDSSNEVWTILPKIALSAAGIASQIIFNGELMNAQSHVFVGRGAVAGADGTIGYYQPIVDPLPEIVLRKEVAETIGKMSSCKYGTNISYDLFSDNDTLYGFVKSELGFFEMSKVFTGINSDAAPDFSVNKNEIIKFNDWCVKSIKTKGVPATMSVSEGILKLEMMEAKLEINNHANIPVKGDKGVFKYDPKSLTTLLKCLPIEDCYFYPGDHRYWITDLEQSFLSAIMLII